MNTNTFFLRCTKAALAFERQDQRCGYWIGKIKIRHHAATLTEIKENPY